MNKRIKTDRELLLDASLEFIMNSPDEVFDQYLKEAGEDGSELERRAADALAQVVRVDGGTTGYANGSREGAQCTFAKNALRAVLDEK